ADVQRRIHVVFTLLIDTRVTAPVQERRVRLDVVDQIEHLLGAVRHAATAVYRRHWISEKSHSIQQYQNDGDRSDITSREPPEPIAPADVRVQLHRCRVPCHDPACEHYDGEPTGR